MYFENEGRENTQACVEMALKTAKERGIHHIVVASGTGSNAILFKAAAKDFNVVCVTCAYGMVESGKNIMDENVRQELKDSGIHVLTTTHVLSGAERGLSKKYGGVHPAEIISDALRMFGQGTKVCVEISIMALDAGLIPYGEDIVAVAGSGRGADTALILRPAHANHILDTEIGEIICKPRCF